MVAAITSEAIERMQNNREHQNLVGGPEKNRTTTHSINVEPYSIPTKPTVTSKKSQQKNWYLHNLNAGRETLTLKRGDIIRIGRDKDNVEIHLKSKYVSRQHCKIEVIADCDADEYIWITADVSRFWFQFVLTDKF